MCSAQHTIVSNSLLTPDEYPNRVITGARARRRNKSSLFTPSSRRRASGTTTTTSLWNGTHLCEMAPRRAVPVEDVEEEDQQGQTEEQTESLRFNEPLSWRPGKPIPTDQLLKRLDRLSKELAEMDQENVDTNSLVKVSQELVSHQLLTHKDKGVRAYTACCLVDMLKLFAPNAPFKPPQLKVCCAISQTARACCLVLDADWGAI